MPGPLKLSRCRKLRGQLSLQQRQRIRREIKNRLLRSQQLVSETDIELDDSRSEQASNSSTKTETISPLSSLSLDNILMTSDPVVTFSIDSFNDSVGTFVSRDSSNAYSFDPHTGDIQSSCIASSEDDDSSSDSEVNSDEILGYHHKSKHVTNPFHRDIATWLHDNNVTLQGGERLLGILRSHPCFASLPKCARTLLNTSRKRVDLLTMRPGKYLNLGFEVAVTKILERVDPNNVPSILEIDFNTDGASLDNSGTNEIWPIQIRAANIPNSATEVVGIYRGTTKPASCLEFFRPFVDEVNNVIASAGIIFRRTKIPVTLRAFIADAPARAFVLNHMGNTSSVACSKCRILGSFAERRMTFKGIDNVLRTDEDIRLRGNDRHYKDGESPLSLLPIGLVSRVPFEYMHLVCLGVMKRLLSAWVDGSFSKASKLSAQDINRISTRLEHLQDYYPEEFARKPIKLNLFTRWKATEFRQFLLYTGPVVLFGIVRDNHYEHFLLLSAAMCIVASPVPSEKLLFFARRALQIFVERSEHLYGRSFLSYNVHGLLYIVDDVKLFGPVDSYSAFPYENNMRVFRRYCRRPGFALQQIANRLSEGVEMSDFQNRRKKPSTLIAGKQHNKGPLPIDIANNVVKQFNQLHEKPSFSFEYEQSQ